MTKKMPNALRLIRVYHDLNQNEAAEKIGISKSYLSELETGNKNLTLDVLEKYSKAFDIPMSSLMIFLEKTDDPKAVSDTKHLVSKKILRMLQWIDDISRNEKESA